MKPFMNVRNFGELCARFLVVGFVCDLVFIIPLHAARRAMAAASLVDRLAEEGEEGRKAERTKWGLKSKKRKKQVESDYVPDCCYTIAR